MATSEDTDDREQRRQDVAEDQALVEAAQADSTRFLDLYDRHFHRVYAYALRRTGNRADAEDVTSEVFHRALTNLFGYEWRGIPFVAWLYRIAAHELSDRRRRAAREAVTQPPDADTSTPEFEQRVLIFQLLDRLPADQRRVVEMGFGDGRSIQETAAALGRSDGAVKQLQRRALERLRTGLEERRQVGPPDRADKPAQDRRVAQRRDRPGDRETRHG